MGSDGIFDNLFDENIIECVKPHVNLKSLSIEDPQKVSSCLSMNAEIKGYDPNYDCPFNIEGRKSGKKHTGGKADDITVIVA